MPSRRSISLGLAFVLICLLFWAISSSRKHEGTESPRSAVGEPVSARATNPTETVTYLDEEEGRKVDEAIAKLLPPDSADSGHPVEAAVARGEVLASRLEAVGPGRRYRRSRLVRTEVQPGLVRVVEDWEIDPAKGTAVCARRDMYLADQLIVRAKDGIDEKTLREVLKTESMAVEQSIGPGIVTVRLARSDLDATADAIAALERHGDLVHSAEPDGVGFGGASPNDTDFAQQWGNHNTGQSGGTADADVDAPEFWDRFGNAPDVVVAVLDSGLNFTHPDLAGIAWRNPGETAGDGIDNDGNGRIDDVRGWDFVNADNDPTDDHAHGTHVTGIMAANRNNGVGVAGMLSGVKILTCKILNASNSGTTSNLIAATSYARLEGAPVMNLSLQNYPFNTTLNAEFDACQGAGILLSICAGNQGVNNDTTPNYPSSYPQSNVIAVGNHTRSDARSSSSNYGLTKVDLFAPGSTILSTVLGTGYGNFSGTSMSTPYVTAVCAMLKQLNPAWTAAEIKARVLDTVVPVPAYNSLCGTGGRLNAMASMPSMPPNPEVTSPEASEITSTGATLGGDVASEGGSAVTERGVVYAVTSVNADPQIGGNGVTKIVAGGTTGPFSIPITGLASATSHTFRAYASNVTGTGYSAAASFTTLSVNADLEELTLSAGTLSPAFEATTTSYEASAGSGVNSFSVTPTSNDPNSTIEVRINEDEFAPVASNTPSHLLTLGIGSNLVEIRVTAQDNVTQRTYQIVFTRRSAPGVSSPTVTSRTATGATLGGTVTSDGGSTVTERGVVCSAISENLSPLIGGTGVTKVASPGTTGSFTATLSGLVPSTGYVFRPYAINVEGTAYGIVMTFATLSNNANLGGLAFPGVALSPAFGAGTFDYGGSVAGSVAFLVFTPTASQANALIEARVNGGSFAVVVSGSESAALPLDPGTNLIEVRVTAQDGTTQKTYFVNIVRRTAPVVIGLERIWTSTKPARLAAEVSADGGASVSSRGFVLAPASGALPPAIGGSGVIQVPSGSGLGSFEAAVPGLGEGTRYRVRAYAGNSEGISYSPPFTFVADTDIGIPRNAPKAFVRDVASGEIQRLTLSLAGDRLVTLSKTGAEEVVVRVRNGGGDVVETIEGVGSVSVESMMAPGIYVFEIENSGGQDESLTLSIAVEAPAPDVSSGASSTRLVGRLFRGAATRQQTTLISSKLRTVRGVFAAGNPSRSPERLVLSGTKGSRSFQVKYLSHNGDFTGAVTAGRYLTNRMGDVDPLHLLDLSVRPNKARLTSKRGKRLVIKRASFLIILRAVAETDPSASDAAACKVMTR